MRDDTSVPDDVKLEVAGFRYKERFHLSESELLEEPYEAISRAQTVWSLDRERAMLEEERNRQNSR